MSKVTLTITFVWNLKALVFKITSGMRKRSKSLIRSLCTNLMRHSNHCHTQYRSFFPYQTWKRIMCIKSNPYISWYPEEARTKSWSKNFGKNSNFGISKLQHTTHLKLFDRMCKYEMDLASIVEDTERTWFFATDGWPDRQMAEQTDGQSETSIPPPNFWWGYVEYICPQTWPMPVRGNFCGICKYQWS